VWNDGTAVTSRDVSRTLDYLLDPDSGATGTLLYQGASISIIDETTFDIVFDSPIGAHRVLFSTIHPVIKAAAYDSHLAGGETAATFMIDGVDFSAGPYQVAGFDSEERLTFVRNDRWWGEAALLDRITVRTYDSARDQLDALEIGELDLVHVEDARATDAARARGFDDVIVDVGVGDQFLRLEMNTRTGPLAEISVRLAIASVIDRELIAEAAVTPITGEVTARADSLIWAGSQAENEHPFARFDGDAEAAAALLQEAGWELDGQGARFRNGEVLEIRLIYAENSSLAEQTLVQAVVVQLLDVGVRVVASVEGSDELFNSRVTGNYDLVLALDVVNTDPVAALFRFGSQYCPTTFGSPGCDSSIGTNLTGIADPALDALLASSSVEADPAARRAIFVEIDQMLSELVPALPLYELPTFTAHAQRLGGVLVNTHRGGPFSDMATWGFAAEVDPE
jgi:peptide/nickel transport system substrate-binding protein